MLLRGTCFHWSWERLWFKSEQLIELVSKEAEWKTDITTELNQVAPNNF